jgi:antitoxin YefM
MSTESLRNVKDQFSEFIDRVQREHERVTITKNGRPAAVLISVEDLEGLEETLEILSDPEAIAGVRDGQAAIDAGDFIDGDELRARFAQRSKRNPA